MQASRTNAFDFLRLFAALLVLYSHSFALYGLREPTPIGDNTSGQIAVFIFFGLSGYLVCQSWMRDPDPLRFAFRRALRIIPGLFVAVLFTAFAIGPAFTSLKAGEYLGSAGVYGYILSNASLIVGVISLPGLFEANPYPNSANGSLWTLRYEVLMYVCLALVGRFAGPRRFVAGVATLLACMAAGYWFTAMLGHSEAKIPLPLLWKIGLAFDAVRIANLGVFFFAGCVIAGLESRLPHRPLLAIVLLVPCFLVSDHALATALSWLAIPYACIVFAYKAPKALCWGGKADFSYGIYIYAFPIQQAISQMGLARDWAWFTVLVFSALATLAMSMCSWYLVEQPALRLKPRVKASISG